MSDTPRTDALETRFDNENMTRDTPWEFARQLERELNAYKAHVADAVMEKIGVAMKKCGLDRSSGDSRS